MARSSRLGCGSRTGSLRQGGTRPCGTRSGSFCGAFVSVSRSLQQAAGPHREGTKYATSTDSHPRTCTSFTDSTASRRGDGAPTGAPAIPGSKMHEPRARPRSRTKAPAWLFRMTRAVLSPSGEMKRTKCSPEATPAPSQRAVSIDMRIRTAVARTLTSNAHSRALQSRGTGACKPSPCGSTRARERMRCNRGQTNYMRQVSPRSAISDNQPSHFVSWLAPGR
jgi:hypothetical protein